MVDEPAGALGRSFLDLPGQMARAVRTHDWAGTPLGAPEGWAEPLKTLTGVMLGATQPMFVVWGDERTLLYNDAYAPILGGRHPQALGRPFFAVWPELKDELAPLIAQAYAGTPIHMADIHLVLQRDLAR